MKRTLRFFCWLCLFCCLFSFPSPARGEDADIFISGDDTPPLYLNDLFSALPVRSEEAFTLRIGLTDLYFKWNATALLNAAFFRQYPNARIEYVRYSADALRAYLFSGEEQLDLLLLDQESIWTYAGQGLLENLSDSLLASWPEDWADFSDAIRAEDGGLYALPLKTEQDSALWNTQADMAKYLTRPEGAWDWDEFNAMCQALKPVVPAGYGHYLGDGSYTRTLDGFAFEFFEEYYNLTALKTGRFDVQDMTRLLRLFTDIMDSHSLTTSTTPLLPLTENGMPNMPYVSFGSYAITMSNGNGLFLTPRPVLDRNDPHYLGSCTGAALLRSAPHPDAAMHYLQSALLEPVRDCYIYIEYYFRKTPPRYDVYTAIDYSSFDLAPNEKGLMALTLDAAVFSDATYIDDNDIEWSCQLLDDLPFANGLREHLVIADSRWYELSTVLWQMMDQYVKGSLSVEKLCDALNSRLTMMLD